MEEQLARIVRGIDTLDRLSNFQSNAESRNQLTKELEAAIHERAIDLGRALIEQRTGLVLTHLSIAEEKIVRAVSEYVAIKKRGGTNANRTIKQLQDHGLLDSAERAVSRSRPTQGFQTLSDEELSELSYEQIIVDHPEEFSPRALWFARKTLGLNNDTDKPPAKATTPTQTRTERLLKWLHDRSISNSGIIPVYKHSEAAAHLDMDDMHKYGRVFGNIQSRIDFACYIAGLPPLGLTADRPFDRAWNQEDRDWAFPVVAMEATAKAHIWRDKDFDRILNETEKLPGQAHIPWRRELTTQQDKIKAWAFQLTQNQSVYNVASAEEFQSRRNPAWSRDELILALSLYFRLKDSTYSKESPEIIELSELLGKLGSTESKQSRTFRNANGVYMKLMNFRSLDPNYISDGKVGLSSIGKQDEIIWNEYSNSPSALAEAVAAIHQRINVADDGSNADTPYWVFVCNPKKWNIDRFLKQRIEHDTWGIRPSDREKFAPGQLGIVRVGVDQRSLSDRNGSPPLQSGIYALCEVESTAFDGTGANSEFWSTGSGREPGWPTVKIRYLRTYADNPLLIERLRIETPNLSPLLLNGFQAASFPIPAEDFNTILSLLGITPDNLPSFSNEEDITADKLAEIETKYLNASPEVKERQSKVIERGPIGNLVKKARGYKCQLCEALGYNPIGFTKKNGIPYIEAHHVMPVAKKEIGSLSSSNILTLCANHHRQMHYGEISVKVCTDVFEITIEGKLVNIARLGITSAC